jgi:hypothetical protein
MIVVLITTTFVYIFLFNELAEENLYRRDPEIKRRFNELYQGTDAVSQIKRAVKKIMKYRPKGKIPRVKGGEYRGGVFITQCNYIEPSIEVKLEFAAREAKRQVRSVLEEGKSVSEYLCEVEGEIADLEQRYDELIKDYMVGGKEFRDLVGYCMEDRQKEVREVRSKLDDLVHKVMVMTNYQEFVKEYSKVRRAMKATRGIEVLDKIGLSFVRKAVVGPLLSSIYSSLKKVASYSAKFKKVAETIDRLTEDCQDSIEFLNEEIQKTNNHLDFNIREQKLKVLEIKGRYEETNTVIKRRIEAFAPRVALYEAVCHLTGKDPRDELKEKSLISGLLTPNEEYNKAA